MKFDKQAAREICIKLSLRYPARALIADEYQCALAAEMLPAALDRIDELEGLLDEIMGNCNQLRNRAQKAEDRIIELERENLELRVAILGPDQIQANQAATMANQNKRIAELEKALIEERKKRMQLDASRFGMGIPEEIAKARARGQLQAEGKI